MNRKSRVAVILCLAVFALMLIADPALAQPTDIQGHWAEQSVNSWVYNGYINGYPDGSFKPDNSITRSEFMVLVNRSFGFMEQAAINFSDVSPADWFYGDAAKAIAAGYISGYEDGTLRPGAQINRQEAAVIIARLLELENAPSLPAVNDAAQVSPWSRGQVGAVMANGVMRGYPDQTFRPLGLLSRAEAIVVLDAARAARVGSPVGPPVGVPPVVTPPVVTPPVVTPVGGGGGGGGGGGASAPTVTAATITVNGTDYDAAITSGKNGTISFAALDPAAVLSEGRINVSRDCTLELTIPANKFLSYGLDISQELTSGWNTLEVFDYLGDIYPAGGFTLAKMKDVFDNSSVVTFSGTLTGASANKATVSLAVTLP
jgi:hypothetical protein